MTSSPSSSRGRDELLHVGWRWTRRCLVVLGLASACFACPRTTRPSLPAIGHGGSDSKVSTDESQVPRTPRPGRRLVDVEIPAPRGHVNDYAHVLSTEQARALEAKLVQHEASTGQQLALLTIERLPGVTIEDLGYTIANRWKLGRACYDDGVLLLIALADRKLRIDVGYGLERAIPDAHAAQVIEEMGPLLRQKQYAEAANLAFDRLITMATASPALASNACVDASTETR